MDRTSVARELRRAGAPGPTRARSATGREASPLDPAGAAGLRGKCRGALVAGAWVGLVLAACQGPEEFYRNDQIGLGQGGSAPTGSGGSLVSGSGGSLVSGSGGTGVATGGTS